MGRGWRARITSGCRCASRAMRSGQWTNKGGERGRTWSRRRAGQRELSALPWEAELRWRASGNGGVDDDGGEEAVKTTVQAEAWAGDSSGRYGSVDGGVLRTDQPRRPRRTACLTHRSEHRERAAGGGMLR